MRVYRVLLVAAALVAPVAVAVPQQPSIDTSRSAPENRRPPTVGPKDPQFEPRRGGPDDLEQRAARAREKRWNKERQARLKQDTEKLYRLAGELKQYVDQTDENVLSLDVIRKSEEIEKLAHDIQNRMKGD